MSVINCSPLITVLSRSLLDRSSTNGVDDLQILDGETSQRDLTVTRTNDGQPSKGRQLNHSGVCIRACVRRPLGRRLEATQTKRAPVSGSRTRAGAC
uniref:Secreted protein n=1 Tax=Ascaris lumbricoides TaxID=6252 RepID=A0A0M3HY70_ASCLU